MMHDQVHTIVNSHAENGSRHSHVCVLKIRGFGAGKMVHVRMLKISRFGAGQE